MVTRTRLCTQIDQKLAQYRGLIRYFNETFASMFQTKIVKIQVPYNKNALLEIFSTHCEVFSPVKRGKQTSSSMPNESGNLLTTESAR